MARALRNTRLLQLRYLTQVVNDLRNPLTAIQLTMGYVSPNEPLPSEPDPGEPAA